MKKPELIKLHNEMRECTLKAGVSEKQYDSVIVDLEEFTEREVSELYTWLQMIRLDEYMKYRDTRNLLSDEIWERYKTMGITGLREQSLLKEATRRLKEVWKKPYRNGTQMIRIKNKEAVNKHKRIEAL